MATNNEQFRKSIITHITELKDYYKSESDRWEKEVKENPRLKDPRENYIRYHWEYRAYDCLLTNINAGNYDSVEYYENYLKSKNK
jgi:hypothetical protein